LHFAPVYSQESHWDAYQRTGTEAFLDGRYSEASKHLEAAVREAETFGATDARLATSLNALAKSYRSLARYPEATALYQRSRTIFEEAFGSTHPRVAEVLNELALLDQELN
jgi:tetratricopeptide (TPR) repeat protein